MKGMTHQQSALMKEEMRKYKAEGHSMPEVAERFGVCVGTAQKACTGICPQTDRRPKTYRNQYTSEKFDRIANVQRILTEENPNYEYHGGFTGADGSVEIRCKVCGHVFVRSLISLRHHRCPECPNCRAEREKENRQKREAEKEIEKRIRAEKAQADRRNKRLDKQLALTPMQIEMKQCPVCGGLFLGSRVYCSTKCQHQNKWYMKDGYRNLFPLKEVYERDKGICHICGGVCDWNDKTEKNGVIVYGNLYPSRDHIQPKSRGGANSWDNIKLAHRICNTIKSDIPLVKK